MGVYLKLKNGQTIDVVSKPLKFLSISPHVVKNPPLSEPQIRLIPHPVLWEKAAEQ